MRIRIPRIAVLRRLLRAHPRLRRLLIGARRRLRPAPRRPRLAPLPLSQDVRRHRRRARERAVADLRRGGHDPGGRRGPPRRPRRRAPGAELQPLRRRGAPQRPVSHQDGQAIPRRPPPPAHDAAGGGRRRAAADPDQEGEDLLRSAAGGQPVEQVELEAPVLATYYGDESREKWPVRIKDLPEHVVRAVLAAEDDSFYWHPGVSPTGIAARPVRQPPARRGGAGGQHAHPAAGQERLPHLRAELLPQDPRGVHRRGRRGPPQQEEHPPGLSQRHLPRRRQRHPVLRPRHRGAGLLRQGRERADPARGRRARRHDQVARLLLARGPPRPRAPAAGRGAPPHGRAAAGSTPAPGERPSPRRSRPRRCASAPAPPRTSPTPWRARPATASA